MIDTEAIKTAVVTGLSVYCGVPVIRSNQNEMPPTYPYLVFTVITPESENNGTFGEYEDGIDRRPTLQGWSISAVADSNADSLFLASKAKDWLDRVGTTYLNDRGVICQETTAVTNRDSVLNVEYEYRNGFDATFWTFSEIDADSGTNGPGEIRSVMINGGAESGGDESGGEASFTETDYENLINLPRINGHQLIGDKSAEDLQLLGEIGNTEILLIWNTVMTLE